MRGDIFARLLLRRFYSGWAKVPFGSCSQMAKTGGWRKEFPLGNGNAFYNPSNGPFYGVLLAGVLASAAQISETSPISTTPLDDMKTAMKLIRQNKLSEAEKLLHKACMIAEHTKDVKTATTGYMLLAQLYQELNHDKKAESLLLRVLQNFLLILKRPENDPAVLAVSLKLANIYSARGDLDKAELGYKFCLEMQRKNYQNLMIVAKEAGASGNESASVEDLTVGESPSDVRGNGTLLAHTANDYGKFMLGQARLLEAEMCFQEGLKVMNAIDSSDPLRVVIEINYAAVCIRLQKFDVALKQSEAALNHLNLLEDVEKGPITSPLLVTYAEALYHRGFKKEAVTMAEGAVRAAHDQDASDRAKLFLTSITKDLNVSL